MQPGVLAYCTSNLIGINLACLVIYVLGGYARSNELGRTLSWGVSLALIAMLIIPLGISFWQLTNKAKVNESVQKILVTRSLINRQDVEVVNLDVDWQTQPPSVKLSVKAANPVTPQEVAVIEDLLNNELKKQFSVVLDVTSSQQVTSVK